jgi:uncharacterized protein
MDIATRLDEDAKAALRAGDKLRLGTIRRARAALKNAEIEARAPLDDRAALGVLRGMVKRHQESIDQFARGGRDDLVEKERAEMAVLEGYLPAPLDDAAVEEVVRQVIAEQGVTDAKGLGKVMRPSIERLGGQVEGGRVREVAMRLLGG